MAGLAIEIKRAEAQNAQRVTKFTGGVRSLEGTGFEVNDTFTFPTEYEIFEQKFRDSNNSAQFIFVKVNNDDNNYKPFYPSMFTKSRAIYNEDLTLTGERAHTTGTAAAVFQACGSVDEAMDKLKGKTVKITAIRTIRTKRYGVNELQNAQIYQIDFVED